MDRSGNHKRQVRAQNLTAFESRRRKAFHRQRAQAHFRNEIWTLTYEDFCRFFPDEQTFNRRGRGIDSICLTLLEPELGWTPTNAILVTRHQQLWIKNRRNYGRSIDDVLSGEVGCSTV